MLKNIIMTLLVSLAPNDIASRTLLDESGFPLPLFLVVVSFFFWLEGGCFFPSSAQHRTKTGQSEHFITLATCDWLVVDQHYNPGQSRLLLGFKEAGAA